MGGPRPTSQEEIDRQHREAEAVVRAAAATAASAAGDGTAAADRADNDNRRGEIPLSSKQRPLCELYAAVQHGDDATAAAMPTPCWSSRGTVDVGPLADLVREGHNDTIISTATNSTSTSSTSSTTDRTDKKKPTAKAKAKSQPPQPPIHSYSPTNLWDPTNATESNVHIVRPSHDAWGIKKLVLIFCDDFLRDVYEMPWWHSDDTVGREVREAVRPVLDALGLGGDDGAGLGGDEEGSGGERKVGGSKRLVRLLLASLPPGVTIPVHHDTGEWVRRTHRVHVPVIVVDPSRILFRCGPTLSAMERIPCHPGHVFEINNQGKHAVSNCHPTQHRVHLILDYVDASFAPSIRRRIRLSPGEELLQTRRSIDRAAERGTRPTPSFLIIGAQKAGTTSLYDYLNQHPLVVRPKNGRRETHCLDWRWDESLQTTQERRERCLNFFHAEELANHPSVRTGDSTPSYLLDSLRVIPRLKEVFPHYQTRDLKLIVTLRDPVRRCKSHFEMVTSLDGTPEQIKNRGEEWLNISFEEAIELDFDNMMECGLIPYWKWNKDDGGNDDGNDGSSEGDGGGRGRGGTIDQDKFDEFVGTQREDEAWTTYLKTKVPLYTGSHSLISRGMYELNLRNWFREFSREDLLVLKLEDMAAVSDSDSDSNENEGNANGGGVSGVQRTVDRALAHLDLPPFTVTDVTAKNTRSYEPMDDSTRIMLQRFYEPHNRRMGELLGRGEKGGWDDPWPYS